MSEELLPGGDDHNDQSARGQRQQLFGALAFGGAMLGILLVIVSPYLVSIYREHVRSTGDTSNGAAYRRVSNNEIQTRGLNQSAWRVTDNKNSDILPVHGVAVTTSVVNLESQWTVERGEYGLPVKISSGALAGGIKPAQGIVILRDLLSVTNNLPEPQVLWTPVRAGSLHLAYLKGRQITLFSEDGSEFVLDLETAQWVSFLPYSYVVGNKSTAQTDAGQSALLPLQPGRLRHATRGMILDYGVTDLPEIKGNFANQWYEVLPAGYRFGYGANSTLRRPDVEDKVRAYAGHAENDKSQGLLVIEDYPEQSIGPGVSYYYTPRKIGGVYITDVQGQIITLYPERPEGGQPFYFDLSSRRWVDSPPARWQGR